MARKPFTTTIDEEMQMKFKISCTEKGDKMNDVLEAFMQGYIDNEFVIEKEVKFKLNKSK